MSPDHLSDLLRSLPPRLEDPVDRLEQVHARVRRRHRRRGAAAVALGAAAVAVVGSVTLWAGLSDARPSHRTATSAHEPTATPSVAPGAEVTPGAQRVTPLSQPVTTVGVGTATIQLGSRPAGATGVSTSLWCLSAGTLRWPDGASLSCGSGDTVKVDDPPSSPGYVIPLDPGQTTMVLRVTPGTGWKIETTYERSETTPWGVNADGQTYGAANASGHPDLVAAYATNGRTGYVYEHDLDNAGGPMPTSPDEALAQQQADQGRTFTIPVYLSDGVTVIGDFKIRPGEGSDVRVP